MKNILSTIILSLLCITTYADINTISGNWSFLNEETTAIVAFDYSEATWEDESYYEQWCGDDFEQRVQLGYGSFILGFNNESSKLKIKQEDSSAKYRITVKINKLEESHGSLMKGGLWGRYYISCFGTIIVEEISTGEVVCTAIIEDEEGEQDLMIEDRLAKCFNALGKATAKME